MTFKEWQKSRIQRRLYHLRKWKQKQGCANCGYNEHPLALDFAHIDQKTKHAGATYGAASGMSKLYAKVFKDWDKNYTAIRALFTEIRKCKVLCKNCHVIETFNDKQFENNHKVSKLRKRCATPQSGTEAAHSVA